jgi:hypothetical protein
MSKPTLQQQLNNRKNKLERCEKLLEQLMALYGKKPEQAKDLQEKKSKSLPTQQ